MANRVLRDWTGSKKIQKCSPFAERFFTRLIMKVDDFGCYPADPVFLKSTLFPLIENLTSAEVDTWLTECYVHGLVTMYTIDDEKFLQIVDFKQRLRQAKGKYPLPTDGQLSVNGRLETKRNENEEETETKAAGELPNDPVLVEKAVDLIDALCDYFTVAKITSSKIYDSVCAYVATLGHRNELDIAALALKNYVAYKARSQEKIHSISSWIGTKQGLYKDGQWIMIDWESRNKNYKQPNEGTKRIPGPGGTDPGRDKDYKAEGF